MSDAISSVTKLTDELHQIDVMNIEGECRIELARDANGFTRLWVHVDGYTVARIARIKVPVEIFCDGEFTTAYHNSGRYP